MKVEGFQIFFEMKEESLKFFLKKKGLEMRRHKMNKTEKLMHVRKREEEFVKREKKKSYVKE